MNLDEYLKYLMSDEDVRNFFNDVEAEARRDIMKRFKDPEVVEDFERAVESPDWRLITVVDVALLLKKQDAWCKKCGECCRRNNPILLKRSEVAVIAKHLGSSYKKLKKRLKLVPARRQGYFYMPATPCPFLRGNRCSIYAVRPEVCRLFPAGKIIYDMKLIDEGRKLFINFFPTYCNAFKEMFVIKLKALTFQYYIKRKRPELLAFLDALAKQRIAENAGRRKTFLEILREEMDFLDLLEASTL
jgi:Fe-S-cluster containining protein